MINPELVLGIQKQKDYGMYQSGVVESQDRTIDVTYRQPSEGIEPKGVYVFATGWLATKSTMRTPALEAVASDYVAVTFDYSNVNVRKPLESNATDMVAVIDSLPAHLKRRAVGLSMGGAVMTMALTKTKTPVESATAVAAAKYIESDDMVSLLANMTAMGPEEFNLLRKHPRHAFYLARTCSMHCAKRPLAVLSEMNELTSGTVHDKLVAISNMPGPPHMRLLAGDGDKLIRGHKLFEAAQTLPFDSVEMYRGGHLKAAHSPVVTRRIIELDEKLEVRAPLQMAA